MELSKEVLQELAKPFPANAISIKVQTKPNDKMKSLCVAYIDARDVMDRLDSVVAGEWSDVYTKAPSGGLECALTVCGVTRRDVGADDNDNETEKAGYSDAFKRAAVKFGIGRFLYSMPKMFAEVKQIGKNFYLADGEEKRLQGIIAAHLSGKPQPQQVEKERPSQSEPAPKVTNEIITSAEWDNFTALVKKADDAGIKHPAYDRAKMDAGRLNGVSNWIKQELEKAAEKRGAAKQFNEGYTGQENQ